MAQPSASPGWAFRRSAKRCTIAAIGSLPRGWGARFAAAGAAIDLASSAAGLAGAPVHQYTVAPPASTNKPATIQSALEVIAGTEVVEGAPRGFDSGRTLDIAEFRAQFGFQGQLGSGP